MKVFLGGTCNESTWRDKLISMLECEYFNPVVEDWTPVDMVEELRQRKLCDYCLYVITPKMTGVYSIAELIDDSHKRPQKTLFCVLDHDDGEEFTKGQMKSLMQVVEMAAQNGVVCITTLPGVATYLNWLMFDNR